MPVKNSYQLACIVLNCVDIVSSADVDFCGIQNFNVLIYPTFYINAGDLMVFTTSTKGPRGVVMVMSLIIKMLGYRLAPALEFLLKCPGK